MLSGPGRLVTPEYNSDRLGPFNDFGLGLGSGGARKGNGDQVGDSLSGASPASLAPSRSFEGEEMRLTIDVEINEFSVPNFVTAVQKVGERQDGITLSEGIPLREVDAKALDLLCRNFRKGVFQKAGKPDPDFYR